MVKITMPNSRSPLKELALFGLVLLFFFVSGGCGLLYQVVWTRKLVLLFGTTSYAVSTVLSIFFLGLGLGSLWGGRLADRNKNLLFIYGIIEIIVGLWAIFFVLAIDLGESAVVAILRQVGAVRALAIAARALLAGFFLIVPVFLMGATLPLLAKHVAAHGAARSMRIGTLYSLNTFGAVVGCAVTGFILIASLGYTNTTLVGAALNCTVGISALVMSRSLKAQHEDATPEPEPDSPTPAHSSKVVVFTLIAFAVSGFCSLALEVLWTRLLAIVFLGTTYAFTTMLTTVLIGIALGSAVASSIIDKRRSPVAIFGAVQLLTGVACIFTLGLFPLLPEKLAQLQVDAGYEWGRLVFSKFFLSFLVLLLPTFLFGMSFPLAVRIIAGARHRTGRDVGRLYMANTFGGVIGALAGGFMIIPLLGTHNGIVALSVILCAAGLLLLTQCPTLRTSRKWAIATAGVVLALLSTAALPSDVSLALNEGFLPEDHDLIYFAEGIEGTVVVSAPTDATDTSDRVLWINAVQATASIEKGVKMNRFQGVLPLLINRDLNNALFMCFGSGITAGTLALSPFESIDAVEISQDVLNAAPLFASDNFEVADNDRVNFIVDDGRNFLLTTKNTYDLITFEPMPLALAGVSTFYTEDYYRLCRAHLSPGGIVSQWVPLHSLSPELVRDLTRTFISVFPEASAWFINADLFLIGSNEPLSIDYAAARDRIEGNPRLRQGLIDVYLRDMPELFACYFMGKDALQRYTRTGRIMTDDRPWAEFLAPKLVYERNVQATLEEIAPYRESPTSLFAPDAEVDPDTRSAIERRHRAHVHDLEGLKSYYGGLFGSAPEEKFRESLEIDPNDYNAQYYLTEILTTRGSISVQWAEFDKAIELLRESLTYAPDRLDTLLALGDAYFEKGDPAEAARVYQTYLDNGGKEERAQQRVKGNDKP